MSMSASGIDGSSASPSRYPEQGSRSAPAPIYVICSPNRQVGKTTLARLLIEHHAVDGRPFEAFDLSDESPSLTDYITGHVSLPNIREMRDQVKFFDSLIEPSNIPKIIDVSHREFTNFFSIVDKIGLFDEAERRAIAPVILFMVDHTRVAADAYGLLRRRFAGMSLLPVRNLAVAKGLPYGAFPHASRLLVSLEVAMLGAAARSFVERKGFSLAYIHTDLAPYSEMSERTRAELDTWFRRACFQFREMEQSLSLIHREAMQSQRRY